jgi:hypothetical protein
MNKIKKILGLQVFVNNEHKKEYWKEINACKIALIYLIAFFVFAIFEHTRNQLKGVLFYTLFLCSIYISISMCKKLREINKKYESNETVIS